MSREQSYSLTEVWVADFTIYTYDKINNEQRTVILNDRSMGDIKWAF